LILTRRKVLLGAAASALTVLGGSHAVAARKRAPAATFGRLWRDRTYYVRPDGNDRNSGLQDSRRGAFRTWQGAYDTIANSVNFNGRTVFIKAGGAGARVFAAPPGTEVIEISRSWQGGGRLMIVGDRQAPENVLLSAGDAPCLRLRGDLSGDVYVAGFQLRAPDNWGIRHGARGNLSIGNLIFDTCANHVGVEALASYMDTYAPYVIGGDAERHIDCDSGFMYFRHPVTIVGERTFGAFVRARNGGRFISDMSFDIQGKVRGPRFEAKELSLINTQGRGLEHFPGNVAGIETTGGVYVR
jgi:hypothetical protein